MTIDRDEHESGPDSGRNGQGIGDGARSIPALIVDRVGDAFFALDTDWRFTYVNESAADLFEGTRENVLGRVVWDQFPEPIETQFPDAIYRAMDEQTPVTFEVYHTVLEAWFETSAYPSENGLSVYMCDVTDRMERERELAQHTAVVDAVQDGVFTLDQNNHVVSINHALEEVLAVDREEIVDSHVETILDVAEVDDDHAISVGRAIGELDVGNATYRELEVPFTGPNGTERVSEVRMVPIEDGDAKLAGIVRDVTDRHEYERTVTSLHEVTRWLLQSNDPEEICAIAVHAGGDLLGLSISGAWLLDDEHGTLDPVAGTADAHDEFGGLPRFSQGEGLVWDVFEAGEPELYETLEDVDGVYNPDTPIRSEIIAPIGTHGVLMTGSLEPHSFDETDLELFSTLVENTRAALDRADRERVLRARTERLERQTGRLEAIATVLSDDLKRELNAVADALEHDGHDLESQSQSQSEWEFPFAEDTVRETLDRAERLVDEIREFARNATAVGARTRIDLETAIETAIEDSLIEHANVVVDDSATLRAAPDRFANMLETVFNDADGRSNGDVTIQVGLLGFDEPVTSARGFFLLDDASEIPPSAHERVLDPASDVVDDADGLGLAVARAIAEAHGWTVSIENGDNGGTRFEVHGVTTLEPQ